APLATVSVPQGAISGADRLPCNSWSDLTPRQKNRGPARTRRPIMCGNSGARSATMSDDASEATAGRTRARAADAGPLVGSSAGLTRRTFLRGVVAGGGAALLAACGPPSAPSSTGAAGSGAPTAGRAVEAPPGGAATPAGWERQWDELVAAARQEGKLVLG